MAIMSLRDGLDVLERRTRTVRIALIAYIVVSLADMLVDAGQISGAIDPDFNEPTVLNELGMLVHLIFLLLMIVSVVLVAMWIYRAHANLWAAEVPGLGFRPGWAVGWYFIPIASLVMPFKAMRELWANSLGRNDSFAQPADASLTIWWGALIVGNILCGVGARLSSVGAGNIASVVDLVSTAVLIVAGWFLLRIVETIGAAQRGGMMVAHVFA
jgi:hypothetical protein